MSPDRARLYPWEFVVHVAGADEVEDAEVLNRSGVDNLELDVAGVVGAEDGRGLPGERRPPVLPVPPSIRLESGNAEAVVGRRSWSVEHGGGPAHRAVVAATIRAIRPDASPERRRPRDCAVGWTAFSGIVSVSWCGELCELLQRAAADAVAVWRINLLQQHRRRSAPDDDASAAIVELAGQP